MIVLLEHLNRVLTGSASYIYGGNQFRLNKTGLLQKKLAINAKIVVVASPEAAWMSVGALLKCYTHC